MMKRASSKLQKHCALPAVILVLRLSPLVTCLAQSCGPTTTSQGKDLPISETSLSYRLNPELNMTKRTLEKTPSQPRIEQAFKVVKDTAAKKKKTANEPYSEAQEIKIEDDMWDMEDC